MMAHTYADRSRFWMSWGYALAAGVLLLAPARAWAEERPADRFAGFPPLGKTSKAERSTKVIASDPVQGLLRPKWVRAMADLGSSAAIFRFKGDIYYVHGPGDGHRGPTAENKGKFYLYLSRDEGKSWEVLPQPEGITFGRYITPAGDKLYNFFFEGTVNEGFTTVQTSDDVRKWTAMQKVYKSPYWLYRVTYDPVEMNFWSAAQSTRVEKGPDGKYILRDVHFVKSKDGFHWEHVSTLPDANINVSEAAVHFEPDRTAVVVIRRKWMGDFCGVYSARPPYTEWQGGGQPQVAEGHSFFECDGQTFMGSRAYYRGELPPEIKESKTLRYVTNDSVAYTVIHKLASDRKLTPWAVVDSMGDCSYPRLVETPTEILCAYYSEHEDNICKPFLAAFDKQEFLGTK